MKKRRLVFRGTSVLSVRSPNAERHLPMQLQRVVAVILLALFLMVPIVQGTTMTVANNTEEVNGNTSSPSDLISDPGPDGISLPEAMMAANAVPGTDTILFDPSLQGTTIAIIGELPMLTRGQLTINGDIDGDGTPDITIDGTNSSSERGFYINASDVTISGFTILNFSGSGIELFNSYKEGAQVIERVVLSRNYITSGWSGILVHNWDHDCTIKDVDIIQNTLVNNGFDGVSISAGLGPSSTNNQIINLTVAENTISNVEYAIAVFANGASDQGSTNNLISGLVISNNTIIGHMNVSLLISAANERNCQDNRVENLLISGNVIDGSAVTLEILGGVGADATRNTVSDMRIVGNTLTGGGIQLVGAQGDTAFENVIDSVLIGWNRITNGTGHGIQVQGGANGATNNTVRKLTILNNLIAKNHNGAGISLLGGFESGSNNVIDGVHILNNTIAENGNYWAGGININFNNQQGTDNLITGVRITNTILWGNEGSDWIRGPDSPDSVKFSILGDSRYRDSDGNFYSSPYFIDSVNMDYQLQRISPAIDRGDPNAEGVGETDLGGNPRIVDGDGDGIAIVDIGAFEFDPAGGVEERHTAEAPLAFSLSQNYPNPFNLSTEISFSVPKQSHVKITIYNVLGELVSKLTDGEYTPGVHYIRWNGTNSANTPVSSGVYYCHITTDANVITKRMTLLR